MDISNKYAFFIAVLANLVGYALKELGIEIAPIPLAIFSAIGIGAVFLKNLLDAKAEKTENLPFFNNPDLFPELNKTALIKNIHIKLQEYPNNHLVRIICLYPGCGNNPFAYNVIIEINPSVGFESVQQFWDREAPDVFEDHFIEVYRKKPVNILRFQEGSFWNNWDTIVVYSLDEIPDNFIMKNYKWLLYQAL